MNLKPCPFCKKIPIPKNVHTGDGSNKAKSWVINCQCGVHKIGVTLEKAIEQWNNRYLPDDVIDFMNNSIYGILKTCGNSYANAWCEKLLTIAKKYDVYSGKTTGNINDLLKDLE